MKRHAKNAVLVAARGTVLVAMELDEIPITMKQRKHLLIVGVVAEQASAQGAKEAELLQAKSKAG